MDRNRVATQRCICIDHYLSKLFCICIAQSDFFNRNKVGPNEVTLDTNYNRSDDYFSLRGKSQKLFNRRFYSTNQILLPAFEKLQLRSTLSIYFICTWTSSLVLCARQLPKSLSTKYRLGLSRYKLLISKTTTNYQLCRSTKICLCHASKLNFKHLWTNTQPMLKPRRLNK